ncbi:MAG: transglutaminase domain-containing protein [Pirellulales bacterium]|nr:transglutaminase domain-containing protein [Pirellulales bacterium]
MRLHIGIVLIVALTSVLGSTSPGRAQFRQSEPEGAPIGDARVQRLKVGIVVTAAGPCTGIAGYTSVPIDWPEQQVKILDEEISPSVKVGYQQVGTTGKMMVVQIPMLAAGQEAKAIVTFEIRRSAILPPEDTDVFELPNPRRLDRQTRLYLGPSPRIESRDRKIRELAREIGADQAKAWGRVEAIYDWVREKVEYKFDKQLRGALAALNTGVGDCEELTSLFIAICRAADIPARTVHVEGHCYPEFYLVDGEGEGHWFPCQAAGSRAFGEMPEFRPILSKGDNFRPPYAPRDQQRYLANHLTARNAVGSPRVRFIRELESE